MANNGFIDDPIVSALPIPWDQMYKRCVIMQKDENGYGLRISGESPVYVESVKPGGAAERAGVKPGDKIIKVSGTLVTKHHHGEVVRMIQNCGSYVGLTLLSLKTPPAAIAPNVPVKAPIQITGPQPVSMSTQQAYDETKVGIIRDAIRKEKDTLAKLMNGKKNKSDQAEIDKIVQRIKRLEKEIEVTTFDVTRQRHASMSAENLTTGDPMMSVTNANAKKSHSFGQYDTRAPIMTMESDDENEDFTNNNNVLNNSRRNSSLVNNSKTHYPDISDIPKTVDALHGHCLQMTRWLLQQNLPPHALLFYTMAGHVFPNLAAQTPLSGRKSVQRLAWQIASTWLVKEAPLWFAEFPADLLDKFVVSLESSQSSLETLFEPYFEQARAIIRDQLDMWRKAVNIGLAPPAMATAKDELHAAIRLVWSESNSSNDIEQTVDSLIAYLQADNPNNAPTLAMAIVLLTIGHFVFACPSKHLLFSQSDSNTCHPINPVLKLSIDSNKKHKRATSLPNRSNNMGYHYEGGHHFTTIIEINRPTYCAKCMMSIWGTYGLNCPNCQMVVHIWCMKNAAKEHRCEEAIQPENQPNDTTPHIRPKTKNRRWNSDARYTILDMIKKTVAPNHEPHAPPLLSSSSSSDDDDDDDDALTTGAVPQSSATGGDATTAHNSTTPTPPNTIQRSESFRQRRKVVPSYRKRSDPALTTSSSTLAGTTASPDQTLTPDISGSPITASPNDWQLSSSEEEDEDQSQNDGQSPGLASGHSPNAVKSQNTIDEDTPPPLPPRPPSEKRKQIYNEIIESERKHVEALKFIQDIFYKPLRQEQLLTPKELSAVFRNTKDLLKVHKRIHKELKNTNVSLEQSLHNVFCGELGKQLEVQASFFCSRHKVGALDTWKARKKDSRLKNFLDPELRSKSMSDCPLARLSLEDLLGTVFQRPLRYQLLLDRLLHATPSDSPEYRLLSEALLRCREIGTIVNEETRKVESEQRLQEITKRTDKAQGLILNLTDHSLVHEGALTWRITKQKCVDVLLVLTDKILVILARDSNERFTLKYHTNPAAKTNISNNKTQHSPLVLLHDLFTRDVATDPTAFFLISTDQDVFYEFAAATPNEKKQWKDYILNTTAAYNVSKTEQHSVSKLKDLTAHPNTEEENKPKDSNSEEVIVDKESEPQEVVPISETNGAVVDMVDDQTVISDDKGMGDPIVSQPQLKSPPKLSRVEGIIRYVREDECRPPDLIPANRVTVHTTQPDFEALALQPEQRIAEIDTHVKQLLEEKRAILANMRGIKNQYEWSIVSDMGEHDHLSSAAREVTFFDRAMSLVSTLATTGLTNESYTPLVSLRDQIDALLARITIDADQSLLFSQQSVSDQSSDETAVYF